MRKGAGKEHSPAVYFSSPFRRLPEHWDLAGKQHLLPGTKETSAQLPRLVQADWQSLSDLRPQKRHPCLLLRFQLP